MGLSGLTFGDEQPACGLAWPSRIKDSRGSFSRAKGKSLSVAEREKKKSGMREAVDAPLFTCIASYLNICCGT